MPRGTPAPDRPRRAGGEPHSPAVITVGAARLPFRDRAAAGLALARLLDDVLNNRPDQLEQPEQPEQMVVLALPRGGLPVASQVAAALGAPLDVMVVRKLGLPAQPELAVGALASAAGAAEPVRVLNEALVASGEVPPSVLRQVTSRELVELRRREAAYRGDRPPVDVAGRTAIVVDDGLATGATARAALYALRRLRPARVVLAVPVAPRSTLAGLADVADQVVCAAAPRRFVAVGRHYDDFDQVTDTEVRRLLAQ